jgi:hypothetical protein
MIERVHRALALSASPYSQSSSAQFSSWISMLSNVTRSFSGETYPTVLEGRVTLLQNVVRRKQQNQSSVAEKKVFNFTINTCEFLLLCETHCFYEQYVLLTYM